MAPLRREIDLYLAMFEQSPAFICVLSGENHVFQTANSNYLKLVGNRDIIGKRAADALPEVVEQGFIELLDKVYRTGERFEGTEVELRLNQPETGSEVRYVDFVYQPIRDPEGRSLGTLAHGLDVTEKVLARRKRSESEENFRVLADNIPQIVWVTDHDGKVLYTNQRWFEYTGQDPASPFRREDWLEVTHPEDRNRVIQAHLQSLSDGLPFEVEYRLRNRCGEYRWHLARTIPISEPNGRITRRFGTATDIHDQKVLAQELHEREQELRTYAEAMPQMAFIANAAGDIVYFNQRFYEYVGLGSETSGWGWKNQEIHHPDDIDRTIALWTKSIRTGEPYEIEYRLKRHDGVYRWHLGRAVPFRNSEGEIVRWYGTNTDIDAQKNAVAARDEFLSLASHELRTPLTSLKLRSQMLLRSIQNEGGLAYTPERVERTISQCEQQILRLERLVDDMLDISRVRTGQLTFQTEEVELRELIEDVIDRLAEQFERAGIARPVLQTTEAIVGLWDRMRLEQVILNLLTNALRYGNRQPIEVGIGAGDYGFVRFWVRDQGIGIAPEDQGKIFERFERLVPSTDTGGLGLGLFITRQIVVGHGGRIHVESRPGSGSRFTVELPQRLTGRPQPEILSHGTLQESFE